MTPFSDYLFQLRRLRGLRQNELAAALGLGSSYISALESCRKDPPTPHQLQRLSQALSLSHMEAEELGRLAALSRRRLEIPPEASKEEYLFAHEVVAQLGRLTPEQVTALRTVLSLIGTKATGPKEAAYRIRQGETAM